jgi:transposase-like protein
MNKYSPETRIKAVELSIEKGAKAASEELGIAASTIRVWKNRYKNKIALVDAAEETVDRPGPQNEVLETPTELAGRSFANACLALDRIREDLEKGNAERGRDDAAWLRSLVGAYKVLVDISQLLSGRPTSREHVVKEEAKIELVRALTEDKKLAGRALPVLLELAGSNGRRTDNANN